MLPRQSVDVEQSRTLEWHLFDLVVIFITIIERQFWSSTFLSVTHNLLHSPLHTRGGEYRHRSGYLSQAKRDRCSY